MDSKDKSMIYSLEKEWREKSNRVFDIGGRNLSMKNHVFFSDCVYFLSDFYCYFTRMSVNDFPYIWCYNIVNEETQCLKLPRRTNKGRNPRTC